MDNENTIAKLTTENAVLKIDIEILKKGILFYANPTSWSKSNRSFSRYIDLKDCEWNKDIDYRTGGKYAREIKRVLVL